MIFGKREALGHDADDGQLSPSKLQRPPDRVGASAKLLLPDAITEHDDRGRSGLFVGIEQRAAKQWRHARESERRRRDLRDVHRLRTCVTQNQIALSVRYAPRSSIVRTSCAS